MTAILLDDEEKSRNALEKLIGDYCPEIELSGVASSGEEAYEMICKLRPQVLFLDIEIAQASSEYSTSFDLLSKLPQYKFEVIFVTAFEHYALRAIRSHALGYVLKPISIQDLVLAVADTVNKFNTSDTGLRMNDLVSHVKGESKHSPRIWIHSQKDIIPINTHEIIRLEAQGKYTDIHRLNGNRVTSSKNIGEFTEILDENDFIKVHRSHIINVEQVTKFSKSDGGYVITTDGATIPLSRNGKERLLPKLR